MDPYRDPNPYGLADYTQGAQSTSGADQGSVGSHYPEPPNPYDAEKDDEESKAEEQPVRYKTQRLIDEWTRNHPQAEFKLHFSNKSEAEDYTKAQYQSARDEFVADGGVLPVVSDNEAKDGVLRIFKAVFDLSNIEDFDTAKERPAQAISKFITEDFYDMKRAEAICWNIFYKVVEAQSHGMAFGGQEYFRQEFDSVWDRLDAVVLNLQQSKTSAKRTLDISYVDRLVDAPTIEFNATMANQKGNKRRGEAKERQKRELEKREASGNIYSTGRAERGSFTTPLSRKRNAVAEDDDANPDHVEEDFITPQSPIPSIKRSRTYRSRTVPKNRTRMSRQPPPPAPIFDTSILMSPQTSHHGGYYETYGGAAQAIFSGTTDDLVDPLLTGPSSAMAALGLSRPQSQSSLSATAPSFIPSHNVGNDESVYKAVICNLLGVPVVDGARLTLEELRFYVRVHDVKKAEQPWMWGNVTNLGPFILLPDGRKDHISVRFPQFRDLAYDRGDVFGTAKPVVLPEVIPSLQRRALGMD